MGNLPQLKVISCSIVWLCRWYFLFYLIYLRLVHDACWFCLGNPQVAKHLLVAISTHAYVALPRGPLVRDHVLILTVGHHQSWLTCSEPIRADITAYKSALKKMYKEEGKVMVTFERNYKTHHYQLQVSIDFLTPLWPLSAGCPRTFCSCRSS